jgi:anti-sigma factor RsiW
MTERINPWSDAPFLLQCERLVEHADSFIDGDLDQPAREKIELHIATCLGCAAYMAHLERTVAALAALPPESAPAALLDSLKERFRQRRGGAS